jgi:hypothetical protein
MAVLPQFTIPTVPVDRRNQILLTSQSPGETTSGLLIVCQYQDWTPKEKLQNFYQKTELSVFPEHGVFLYCFLYYYYYSCIINFTITILLSLFLSSSLYLLLLCYNPLFPITTTLFAPSHPLFTLSSPPPPILSNPVTNLPLSHTYSKLDD